VLEKTNTYFKILDSFVDSIAVLDQVGKIIFINTSWKEFSSKNSGEPHKTGLGINYLTTCKGVMGNEIENAFAAQIGIQKVINKEARSFELEYPCHSIDEKRWFVLRATPLETDTALTIVSHINITKRKIAEDEVKDANAQMQTINERLNSTIYKIVHDIQSPLNSIEGLVNLTKLKSNKDEISNYFELISKSVINLKTYVQNTLEMSKLSLVFDSLNFKKMVEDFVESIQYTKTVGLVRIEVNVEQESDFYSNKNEINSILSNLIENCLKYSDLNKTDPFITINIQANSKEAIISISDNGIGIKKNELAKIFDLNFQANKGASSGAGVGLHMVKKSISILNGTIYVTSNHGLETKFIITIPNCINLIQ
jgi:signal transduction histidine kinase